MATNLDKDSGKPLHRPTPSTLGGGLQSNMGSEGESTTGGSGQATEKGTGQLGRQFRRPSDPRAGPGENPGGLPAILAGMIAQARDNYSPPLDDADRVSLPLLFDLISPRLVPDPNHNGPHEPRKVLREPLLMVSWDRSQGRWKWAISDKTLNVSLTGSTERLSGLLEAIEKQVNAGSVGVRIIKLK